MPSAARDPIFSTTARTDGTPKLHHESTYEFYNRVAGDFWKHPRQLMQTWADAISNDDEYHDLCQRFRSCDDDQFRSAFLELYLHECLRRAGFTIIIHPEIPGTSRRPDFYAERDGTSLYLEAIAPGTNSQAKSAAKRRASLFDYVDKLGDPNFILGVVRLREGLTAPPTKRLTGELKTWLASLNPDDYVDYAHAPQWTWEHEQWSVTFKAIPKSPEVRGKPSDRAIGVFAASEATFVDDAPAIRAALANKHHAYGDMEAPFIIAVGTYSFDPDRWHSTNALYGREVFELVETEGGETLTPASRQADGYFGAPPNWLCLNVSGVLLVNQLMPENAHRAEVTLWRHPNPRHPLPAVVGFPAVTVAFSGNSLSESSPPIPANHFFDLPDPWPPGEPWPRKG
ncbi:hypothetical protein [Rhodococcus triatomae]